MFYKEGCTVSKPSERLQQSGMFMGSKATSEVMLFTNDGKQHLIKSIYYSCVLIFNLSCSRKRERQVWGHSGNTVKVNDGLQAAKCNIVLFLCVCVCVCVCACIYTAVMCLCNYTSTQSASLLILICTSDAT